MNSSIAAPGHFPVRCFPSLMLPAERKQIPSAFGCVKPLVCWKAPMAVPRRTWRTSLNALSALNNSRSLMFSPPGRRYGCTDRKVPPSPAACSAKRTAKPDALKGFRSTRRPPRQVGCVYRSKRLLSSSTYAHISGTPPRRTSPIHGCRVAPRSIMIPYWQFFYHVIFAQVDEREIT